MESLKKYTIHALAFSSALLLASFFIYAGTSSKAEVKDNLQIDEIPLINSFDESGLPPAGFRTSKAIVLPKEKLELAGLKDLNISGSSQFSEMGLGTLVKKIGSKKVTIVNLREEEVGFLEPEEGSGGFAFSFANPKAERKDQKSDFERTVEEIESAEERKMQEMMRKKTITLYGADKSKIPTEQLHLIQKINIVVKRALTEKELVAESGLGYFRLPTKKFQPVSDDKVDAFVAFVKGVPDSQWLHFHDETGLYRTTLYMAMFDMIKNADSVSAEEIIKRHGPKGLGGADLLSPDKKNWDYAYVKCFREFLIHFHSYVLENKGDHFKKSWSLWAKENHIPKPSKSRLPGYHKKVSISSSIPKDKDIYRERTLILNSITDSGQRVHNFRTTQDLWIDDKLQFDRTGLKDYFASGSSQYNTDGLKLLIQELKQKTDNVVIVDLRADDHLFVNGLDVCSFETKDVLQEYKTPEEVNKTREELRDFIASKKGVELSIIDTQYPRDNFDLRMTIDLRPTNVQTPEEIISDLGAVYMPLGNNRFTELSDENMDELISLYRSMPKDTWYHFHCKKGKTRTTLFLTLFDMMHNADKVSPEEIIKRQRLIGGSELLDVTPSQPAWEDEKASKMSWVTFMLRFHRYAKENKATNFEKPWSQWSLENAEYNPSIAHLIYDKNEKK